MYSRINVLCHWTIFSLLLHEVDHLKTLVALLSSEPFHDSCPDSYSFLCIIKCTSLLCHCTSCLVIFSIILIILNIMCSHQRNICLDDILGVTFAEGVVNDGVSVV